MRRFRNRFYNFWAPTGSSLGPFGIYLGPEFPIYRKRGFLGRLVDRVPAPLKAFAVITGTAALTVLLAPAIIILATPPLICGAWWVHKQRKALRELSTQLHDQRWKDMASFHLQDVGGRGSHGSSQFASQRIPTSARIILESAVAENEQGLAQKLGVDSENPDLHVGSLQILSQDFRMSLGGTKERMSLEEYPIYVGQSLRGTIRVITRGDTDAGASKGRIEVATQDGNLIVLNRDSSSSNVIDGHGTRIN